MPLHASYALRGSLLALATLVSLLAAPVTHAAEIEDVPFPDQIGSGAGSLDLYGLGLLRYRVLFRGYVGGLYLPDGIRSDRLFENVPKALELYYFWDIEGRFFGDAAEALLERSLPPERLAALRGRLDRLHALYRDVEEGDRYRLTYSPGVGTTVALNGEPLGTIPGADFAADYFGIWLGEEPLDRSFRDQVLGGLSEQR
ncbi:MAG: chalcone isomerase family protein [Myxococcota bacterium]